MVNVDINKVIKESMSANLEEFKVQFREEIRTLQGKAWDEGFQAAEEDPYGSTNPYLEENDTGGQHAGDSSSSA